MRKRVSVVAIAALALPLAACSTAPDEGVLASAGCPGDIRIQTDDLPNADWGFLYSLLDPVSASIRPGAQSVTGLLLVDGEPSGVKLTILSGDPGDGVSAAVALHDDESILLGAVDTDAAVLQVEQYPTIGLFAPTAKDPRMVYWAPAKHPGVRSIEQLGAIRDREGVPVPITLRPNDPFGTYMLGSGRLPEGQVQEGAPSPEAFLESEGLPHAGDLLVDPVQLRRAEKPREFALQSIDDAGYPRDTLLAARPQAVVRYADCFRVLIPVLQQAIVDYVGSPTETNAFLVKVAGRFGHPELDAEVIVAAYDLLVEQRMISNGFDSAIGDVDFGRVRELISDMRGAWAKLERRLPPVEAEDIVSNEFVDRSIGL